MNHRKCLLNPLIPDLPVVCVLKTCLFLFVEAVKVFIFHSF